MSRSLDKYAAMLSVDDRGSAGEVATPIDLAVAMLDEIPEAYFISNTTTFFDPCFGNGTFIIEVIKKLRSYGHSIENIETRVYGCEISKRLFNKVKKKLAKYNFDHIILGDSLEREWSMRFDVGIANPPYNDDTSNVEGSNHKQKTKGLHREFIDLLTGCCDFSAIIAPTKSYWVGRNKASTEQKLASKGLFRVAKCDAFEDKITLDGVAVYYFDKSKVGVEVDDEFAIILPEVNNPLGAYLKYGSNDLIGGDVKNMKFDKGEDTLYITTKRDVLEGVNLSSYPDPSRGKWRVILSQNGGREKYGMSRVIKPGDGITYSCVYFEVPNEEIGNKLVEWLAAEEQLELAKIVRCSSTNSKDNFKHFEAPSYLVV